MTLFFLRVLRSGAFRVAQTSPRDFNAFRAEISSKAKTDGASAWNQIRQRQAIIALDLPAEFGLTLRQAAKRARSKLLAVVSPQDHMVNPAPALRFAKAAGAPVVTLDSSCGHSSFTCVSVGPSVAQFLADPASAHSVTLRGAKRH